MTVLRKVDRRLPPEDRPVLFLDVDGVLNDETYLASRKWRGLYGMIDRAKVDLLNQVVARTGCLIVMSSAWRSDTRFRRYFRRRGALVTFHRDWRTRQRSDTVERRGREIADWLDRNGQPRYAIVDDDSDMLTEQRERFVHTNFKEGLTPNHAERLVVLLGTVGVSASKSTLVAA